MTSELRQLSDFQLDVLREVGNIGAGNAATALSNMLHQQINMTVPRVHLCRFDDIAAVIGGNEQLVVGVFLRVSGSMAGSIFFLLQVESANRLLESVLQSEPVGENFNEMQLSALSEMGNILAGSYLSALADFTHSEFQPTVPAIAVDMAGAILSVGLIKIGQSADVVLVIDTEFSQGNWDLQGHFFLLPDPGQVDQLFDTLGVKRK